HVATADIDATRICPGNGDVAHARHIPSTEDENTTPLGGDVPHARHTPATAQLAIAIDVDAVSASDDIAHVRHVPAARDDDAPATGSDVAHARHVAIAIHVNAVAAEHLEHFVRCDDVHRHRAAIAYNRIEDLTDHVDDVILIADIPPLRPLALIGLIGRRSINDDTFHRPP